MAIPKLIRTMFNDLQEVARGEVEGHRLALIETTDARTGKPCAVLCIGTVQEKGMAMFPIARMILPDELPSVVDQPDGAEMLEAEDSRAAGQHINIASWGDDDDEPAVQA